MVERLARIALVALALLAGAPPASAGVTGEVVDWGITTGRREPSPDPPDPEEQGLAPSGKISGIRYLERTDTIEARLCRGFGMTVRLSGRDAKLPLEVEGRVSHPTMTRPDGVSGQQARMRMHSFDGTTYVGFTFDTEWEMVPGTWTFSVLVRGVEVARQVFTIVSPPAGEAKSECVPETIS